MKVEKRLFLRAREKESEKEQKIARKRARGRKDDRDTKRQHFLSEYTGFLSRQACARYNFRPMAVECGPNQQF